MADDECLPPRVRHARADLLDAFERLAEAVMPALPDGARPVDMFHNPRYIVLHAAPGLTLPDRMEGLWLDARDAGPIVIPPDGPTSATASPTGRYEVRESDGCWAEVYEVTW